jgi:hypothetical protein
MMKLKDFLKAFDGLDPNMEVSVCDKVLAGNNFSIEGVYLIDDKVEIEIGDYENGNTL